MFHNNNLTAICKWNSIEDFFQYLNKHVCYVVLRNYECLPEKYTLKDHEDIDLLVYSLEELKLFVGGKWNSLLKYNGTKVIIKINNEEVKLDVRYVGDGYYDSDWERNILSTRIIEKDLFYRPNDLNYRYSLAYHALIHKQRYSDEYAFRLYKMFNHSSDCNNRLSETNTFELLNKFLEEKNYRITEPRDVYVGLNTKYYVNSNCFRRIFLQRINRATYILTRICHKLLEVIWAKR